MPRFVIDTHAFLWFLAGNSRLSQPARGALADPNSSLVIPAIALAEALWIASSRDVGVTSSQILSAVDKDERVVVQSLTRELVEVAQGLTAIGEMHDRMIAATALTCGDGKEVVPVVTKDDDIANSGLVSTVW